MRDEERLNPGHREIRLIARIMGPVIVLVGVTFAVVGIVNFFSSMGTGELPRYFWCAFVGLPMIGLGIAVTQIAYLGWFLRYLAGEAAPVQRDTFNYVAKGIRPGVKDLVQAVREGLSEDSSEVPASDQKFCLGCGQPADLKSNFCGGCGQKL